MKKTIAIVLSLIFVLCAMSACGDTKDETTVPNADTTVAPTAEGETAGQVDDGYTLVEFDGSYITDGALTVAMEIGYPPFEMYDANNKPIGFDVDLAYAVADILGMQVNIVPTGFDIIFANLGTNYDCVISGVTYTSLREQYMDFSDSYINNYQCVVLKSGSPLTINSMNDLNNLSVAVQDSTTSDELITSYKDSGSIDCTISRYEKVTTCFTSLANGEFDAVLCDSTVADYYIANNGGDYTVAWTQTDSPETMAIAIPSGDTGLQTKLNTALAQLKANGTLDELYTKWFKTNTSDLTPAEATTVADDATTVEAADATTVEAADATTVEAADATTVAA